MYKEKWDEAYKHDEKFRAIVDRLKFQAEKIDEDHFTAKEKQLLHIV